MRGSLLFISFLFLALSSTAQDSTNNRGLRSLVVNKPITTFKTSPQTLPANQATVHYGFFCRQELRMEKRNIPVKLRLGSMEYCNWLENKPGYSNLPLRK